MTDYIEREAAKGCVKEHYDDAIIIALDRIPAADVRPIVRGEWEEVEVSYIEDMYDKGNLPEAIVSMYCPICERYHNEVYWYGNPTENINFCPHCGADMRGKADDSVDLCRP